MNCKSDATVQAVHFACPELERADLDGAKFVEVTGFELINWMTRSSYLKKPMFQDRGRGGDSRAGAR